MNRSISTLWTLVFCWALSTAFAVHAQPTADEPLPDDTCVLQLQLPKGAAVTVDGRDYGDKRKLTFKDLDPANIYTSNVAVRFRDGDSEKRKVLIQGGWHTVLPLLPPHTRHPELVLQRGHVGDVTAVSYTRDGQRALTTGADHNAILWDAGIGRQLRTFTNCHCGVVSNDGSVIAVGSADNSALIFDATSGKLLHTLRGHKERILSVAIGPDVKRVLTASRDGTAILWDASSGASIRTFRLPVDIERLYLEGAGRDEKERGMEAIDRIEVLFSPDGYKILTLLSLAEQIKLRFNIDAAGRAGSVTPCGVKWKNRAILWDATTGEKLNEFVGGSSTAGVAAFSSDGKYLVVANETSQPDLGLKPGQVTVWEVNTGAELHSFEIKKALVSSVQILADGRGVVTASNYHAVFWDATNGNDVRSVEVDSQIHSVWLDADATTCYAASKDGTAILWNFWTTGKVLRRIRFGSPVADVASLAISPDGKRLLVGSFGGTASIWELGSGQLSRTLGGHDFSGVQAVFSHDGEYVLTGSGNKTKGGEIFLWNASTGERIRTFEGHKGYVWSVAFSADDQHILTGSDDYTAKLWETSSGRLVHTMKWTRPILSVAFRPNAKDVAVGCSAGTISLWDTATGKRLRYIKSNVPDQDGISSVAFSRDGRKILAAGKKSATAFPAALWDVATGEVERVFKGHTDIVLAVALSSDGRLAATGSGDRSAALWNVQTGRILHPLEGHIGVVTGVVFGPRNQLVVTGSYDGTVRIWDSATGRELARLISFDRGADWLVVTPQGLFDGSYGGRQKVSYRVGGGADIAPVDRFFQDFYYPGLLAAIWRGERPMPGVDFAAKAAPIVRIESSVKSGTVETREVTFQAEVTDRGGGVKGPWLIHNGARVLVPGEPVRKGNVVRRTFNVPLVEGENRLEIHAASEDGSWESEPARLVLQYKEPLAEPELYLVAVGVSRYAEETMRLKFAAADAEAMAQVFSRRGPHLYGEGKVHVTQVLDQEATKAGIQSALAQVAQKAGPQDTLVLFLAGHGTMVGQRYYFITHDFKHEAEKLEDDIRRQGLPGDELDDSLRTIPALKRVVIYDTCQSGGAMALARTARNPFAFRGALERMSRATGSFAIAATAASAEAQEVSQLGHGVLTYALLAGLGAVEGGPLEGQPLKTEKPVIEVRDWFDFAQDKVPLMTRLFLGEEQFVGFSGQGTSFPVLPIEVE